MKGAILCFEIDDKYTIPFKVKDPFNRDNTLEGFINRRNGSMYGSLYITKVNGEDAPQTIFATPKMGYPFDRNAEWNFPLFNQINIYEKLDGTNILSYVYEDSWGNQYLTFKTRLRPVLGTSKFGNFHNLWTQTLDIYPDIKELCFDANTNFSFELFGKKNKVYITYPEMIDTRILFVRSNTDGKILLPFAKNYNVPVVKLLEEIPYKEQTTSEMIDVYEKHKEYLQTTLVDTPEGVTGIEGTVWYFCHEQDIVQMKAKSQYIQDIHFKSDRIPYHSIYITIVNSLENKDKDEVTTEFIKQLLQEEFTISQIEKADRRIDKILTQVLMDKEWQADVLEHYEKLQVDIHEDKGTVMRYFSQHYPKEMCRKIFGFLW